MNKTTLQNPYIKGAEGRKEWNDRYMNMAQAMRNWQIAFFGLIRACHQLSEPNNACC
jgi:type IV secretory pathway TrbF-like protein